MKAIGTAFYKLGLLATGLAICAAVIYFRSLSYRKNNDLPVPDWYAYLDAIPYFWLLIPLLVIAIVWALWIRRPSTRSWAKSAPPLELPSNDETSITPSALHRVSSPESLGQEMGSTSYSNRRAILIAIFGIWVCFEFLRQVLLPPSINDWIDSNNRLLLLITLGAVGLFWLCDSLFAKLPNAAGAKTKPPSRIVLIIQRIGATLFLAAVFAIIKWLRPNTDNPFDVFPQGLDYYLLAAIVSLSLSLFAVKR